MLDKLKSRKLWITLLCAACILLIEALGIDVDIEALMALAGLGGVYIAGQSLVDSAAVRSGPKGPDAAQNPAAPNEAD